MTPAEYKRAGELFEQLRERPADDCASALDTACAGDLALRHQVQLLLDADRQAADGSFLGRRAIEDAARFLQPDDSLAPGTKLGPYEITGFLGAGGMGEVYRARDRNLDREVALKVLPAALASDARYMARFEREAKVLASLNHPNIATIYGIEQGALVMELVEGDNLRGPLPLDEAIPIARQIAAGLEAAHERGVVHRDLKPANIKITPSGVVKLLDFGLARTASDSTGSDPNLVSSPTSPVVTQHGTILGTAAYMSPEQARGKAVDKRTDIWAFGAVLYELLTGRQLFAAGTTADALASLIRDTPDLSQLPTDTPPHIRRLLVRCLRKDANVRLRDIGEARLMLDGLDEAPAGTVSRPRSRWMITATVLTALIAAAAVAVILRIQRSAAQVVSVKLSVLPPGKTTFSAISIPAISTDGHHLAFVAGVEGKPQLWIRDLDALTARVVPGTDGAVDPFWSPDSRFLAFFVPGKLKKVALDGSPPVTICDAADGRGGSWSQNDVILFAPDFGSPLSRVPASGGTPAPVTVLDTANDETSHRFPWFLPDGHHFVFTAKSENPEHTAVYLGDLNSHNTRRLLVAAASNVAYSQPGYLLFMRERTLLAQAFDVSSLATSGQPFSIAQQVDYLPGSIQGQFAVSQNGTLIYFSGGGTLHSQMTWIDRKGASAGTVGEPGIMQAPAISPDGRTVVVDRIDGASGTYDIWLRDLAGNGESRLTFDPGNEMFPVWSPDGSRVLYTSDRNGRYGLYSKAITGSAGAQLFYQTAGVALPTDWHDARTVLFSNSTLRTENDLWILHPPGDASPFLATAVSESQGKLSPDGRWLAYESTETGQANIYVVSFPAKESKWQVSADGGTRPVWRRDGKELFYIGTDNKMMAVAVSTGAGFRHGVPTALFDVKTAPTARFDVAPDGRRFLILGPGEPDASAPMTAVLNWH